MRKEALFQNPKNLRPHVVLLGAGASLAAFPNGDKNGKQLPVMNNFVQVVGLENDLRDSNINPSGNFEEIYANIIDKNLKKKLEEKILTYFASLELPDTVTIYDCLLLSLRDKDAIFTFNWDPFLFEAFMRNRSKGISLPEIFFLHGNVRLVACSEHYSFNYLTGVCDECGKPCGMVPLLYPIEKKEYFKDNNYIKVSWEQALIQFKSAFTITIFGYGAPSSDVDAVKLLRTAWLGESARQIEHIEIIDTADHEILANRWGDFAPTHHYHIVKSFQESRLWRWPRRSCESLLYSSKGEPCEVFPLPETEDHDELKDFVSGIARYEQEKNIPLVPDSIPLVPTSFLL